MPTFVALLRGVNVGKAKRVPMAELRALLGELGYTDAATLLNSGNAVFRAARGTPAGHAKKIADTIVGRLGEKVPVIVLTAATLDAVVAGNALALGAGDPSRLIVAFVQDLASLADLAGIAPLVAAPERFLVGAQAAYLDCASGILESKAGAALLGKAGRSATTRNWATVMKLQAMAKGVGA